jgi:hypothetical protein
MATVKILDYVNAIKLSDTPTRIPCHHYLPAFIRRESRGRARGGASSAA